MLQMKRHRSFTLSYWLVFSLFSFGLLFLANLPGSIAQDNSACRLDNETISNTVCLEIEVISNTVCQLPFSLPSCPDEGAAQPPPPPDELSAAAVPDQFEQPQTLHQTPARVNDSNNDNEEEEEWPKPADAAVTVAVFTSCITLVNTIPARDTIHSPILYYAYMAFLFLAFFTILGPFGSYISTNSNHVGRDVVRKRKQIMMVAVALLAVAIMLRSTFDLPIATVGIFLPLMVTVGVTVLVFLQNYQEPTTDTAGNNNTDSAALPILRKPGGA